MQVAEKTVPAVGENEALDVRNIFAYWRKNKDFQYHGDKSFLEKCRARGIQRQVYMILKNWFTTQTERAALRSFLNSQGNWNLPSSIDLP